MRIYRTEPADQLGSVCLRCAGAWPIGRSQLPSVKAVHPSENDVSEADSTSTSEPKLADSDLARLEAILFLAREPLNTRKLSRYANLADGTRARTLIRQLNERYEATGRAFRVQQVAGGYQLMTRQKLSPWLRRLAHVPGETRLSAPTLETLAVIAYRQPVPRADIEAIRGVNCGEILRQLMDRDLVRIGGRGEELGRPYLYATTKRFLELFGLNQIDELPRASELQNSPLNQGAAIAAALQPSPQADQESEISE